MIAKFGSVSLARLRQADARLQSLAHSVIKLSDHSILCAHRGAEEQNKAYKEGKSKLRWPTSKHNSLPSKAIDVAPYPIDWNDIERFKTLIELYERIANEQGIAIRTRINLGTIARPRIDWPHVELRETN